jgi:hypothetical protein
LSGQVRDRSNDRTSWSNIGDKWKIRVSPIMIIIIGFCKKERKRESRSERLREGDTDI